MQVGASRGGRVVYAYYPSTWVVSAGRSGVQVQPELHSECEASLGYMKPCLQGNKVGEGSKWGVGFEGKVLAAQA